MWRYIFLISNTLLSSNLFGQEKFTIKQDLRTEWMTYEDGGYKPLGNVVVNGRNTVYFQLAPERYPASYLRLRSGNPFFLFMNGKVMGEFRGTVAFNLDSLTRAVPGSLYSFALHQRNINERDLRSEILGRQPLDRRATSMDTKPDSYFRDFVGASGLVIIMLFLLTLRLNPKLAGDYFSVARIFSAREAEDTQSSARLTSSSNVQFYILCSLLLGFYLIIILRHLPRDYALPLRFQASGFWMMCWQWLKLSTIIFYLFLLKIVIIFLLTRLFGMRGMARFHFFNWIRLLLIVFGAATIILFIYFTLRGDNEDFFVAFLSFVIIASVVWIGVAFFKLSGRSEHSLFHLFSYICATEIIPLLITVKVLFQ